MKDLTKVTIDGVEVDVIAREKVIIDSAMSGIVGAIGAELKTVEQLLLGNETIVFQCMHPADPDCTYIADVARSVTAHQRTHGGRAVAKRAQVEIEAANARAAALTAELAERKRRRSEGSRQGALTRQSNRAHAPVEIGGKGGVDGKTLIGDTNLAKAAQNVITAFNAMQTCADEFQKVLIGYMRAVQTASETPVIDPQILAKAQQYDAMKAAMKAMNDL